MLGVVTQALYIIEWSPGIDKTIFLITEKRSIITLATFHVSYFIISKVINTIFNAHKRILVSEVFFILED